MSSPSGCVNCNDESEIDTKHEAECSEGEDAQIRIAPHVQAYLAHNNPTTTCCGLSIPIAFERAAPGTWWNPRFDSEVLEGQYRNSSFRQIRLRFRFALLYILIFSITWFIYFVVLGLGFNNMVVKWPYLCSIFGGVLLITCIMLFITFTNVYKVYTLKLSLVMALALCALSLSLVTLTTVTHPQDGAVQAADISQSGHFTMCIEILLIIYTLTPLPLYACVVIGLLYSIIFEILNIVLHMKEGELHYPGLFVRILLQLCVHIIGVHIYLMTFVRMRGTFMKVGQSLLVRRQLEMEKQLKEKMIHSVMPPKLASWLMDEQVQESDTNLRTHDPLNPRNSNPGTSDIKSLFRPFNMSCMDNVSILFADIVGFTRMSSNKGAEELVNILNDLFEKFDELCKAHGCEKISTLGDCYYCVSGCPEPRPDHATCCVEMGLGMIEAIQEFDRERGEGINMRVGVHTGTVLCGIVGTRRFKFDVWSNDVSFANKMESTGKPGRVHISEETSRFLGGSYVLEEGEEVFGHKTFFIEGRQLHSPYDHDQCLTPSNPVNLRLIISPAASPQSILSFNHSPQPPSRGSHRNNTLAPHKPDSSNYLSPTPFHFRTKASSLPSILDSDAELEDKREKAFPERADSSSKSPTSVGSYGKYTNKLKNWKVPKFLRKHSDTPLHEIKKQEFGDKTIHFLETGAGIGLQSNNGYHQVPIVIESQDNKVARPVHSSSKLNIPQSHEMACFEREIIDIRSYLSQSRSNMSPFARSSSYRSQYGRPNHIEVPPPVRARSSTLSAHQGGAAGAAGVAGAAGEGDAPRPKERRLHLPLAPPARADDSVSLCPSVNSRKDSGIRSTSRRSSIQHQIFALNNTLAASQHDMMQQRVSGYYTSSQSSLNETSRSRLPPPLDAKQVESLQKLRKQSDLHLIRCVQDNARSGVNYFVQPPLTRFTLCFKTPEMEKFYRDKAHRSDDCEDFPPTLTTSRFNTALDILVSAIIFLSVAASTFALYDQWRRSIGWFLFFILIEAMATSLCVYRHYLKWKTKNGTLVVTRTIRRSVKIFKYLSNWYPWHLSGSLLISLPILAVLINFSCQNTTLTILQGQQPFYVYLFCTSVVHFCNFTQMNWLVKNVLVSAYSGLFLFLAVLGCHEMHSRPGDSVHKTLSPLTVANNETDFFNGTVNDLNDGKVEFQHEIHLKELYLDTVLLLMLVWFLNREFEISYRLSFYSNFEANRDKQKVQNTRNQADWLLHNIIPRHVADQLKNTAKYSENHKDAGIIFASIVNFNEMYDESYLKGKEYLRVLNELIADFDELLERSEFQHVEKIKTIGSTFMAASGLNPDLRRASRDPHEHLFQLMDFALEMQKVVDNFNQDLLEFDFILRIGFNFGDVTAGVIGTTKLYYDIWGDAVNIASRMDSTGVPKRIQVGEACIPVLSSRYEFEQRGSVYVKGKDDMNVYLVIGKRNA
ncbi:adenylate cyclase type 9 [Hyposmocoma kahamanoa]|uniref:adenylate cyclase type 9 n=1 Tax=Hyposmocoma kahamanoa TaxID=1477025 RepID=UPI000E6D8B02|nr:adenylate cyclase type 9 [Hyposmocoma kahamanoa]